MKLRLMIFACAAAVASCALVFTRPSHGDAASDVRRPVPAARQDGSIPEHVAYDFLFRRTARFRKKAVEAGRPEVPDAAFHREARLNTAQARALEEVAAAVSRQVEAQDARARVVIERFRARYPGGVVPRGKKLPPPPPELRAMQEERNAIILRGRDHLRGLLGEQKFAGFNDFVLRRFAGKGIFEEK